ncbi:MAG TPA: porin family protein [Chitinophagaceae bacterium]|nr:porin family protein [Chitinophagaceae bacterium]
MKKYFLIIGLLLFVNAARTQVLISILLGDKLNTGKIEFGLDGGANWSTIRNLDGAKSLTSFNLGFYFDFKLKNPSWMLNTGVIVKSNMGADELPVYSLGNPNLDNAFIGGKITRKINYFNVPIMMKYSFKNHIYLKAGTQLGLRYKAFDEFKNSLNEEDDLNYKLNIKDQFHPLDAGLAFGAGYRLMKGNGMNIGLQYYLGLIDIRVDDSSPNQFNRVLYLTAGIPIGKNPKKKKTEEPEK